MRFVLAALCSIYDLAKPPPKKDAKPETVKTPPRTNNRIDLFVGAPLKNFETEETNDADESNPYINTMTPTTSNTIPVNLFIFSFLSY